MYQLPKHELFVEPQPPARFPWPWLTIASALAAMIIARAELSRLSGDLIDTTGRSWAFNELTGFASLTVREGWSAVYAPDVLQYRQDLVGPYWVLGAIAALLFAGTTTFYVLARGRNRRTGVFFVVPVLFGALGVAESAGMALATSDPSIDGFLAVPLTVISTARWVAMLFTLVVVVWLMLTPPNRGWQQTWRAWRDAIRKHRLSIVPVVVVGLVTLTPAAEILDQVPDVVRRWADPEVSLWEPLLAILSLLAFCCALWVLGRARLKLALRNYPEPPGQLPDPKPTFWMWGPIVVMVLGVAVRIGGGPVSWGRLIAFCAVPGAILLLTVLVGRWERHRGRVGKDPLLPPVKIRPVRWHSLRAIVVLGDVLAIALLDIAALGAIRAFTGVVAVQAHETGLPLGYPNPWAVGLLIIGALSAVSVWPIAALLVAALPVPQELYGRRRASTVKLRPLPRRLREPWVILLACIVGLLAVGCVPDIVQRAGVLASFVLSLGLLTGLVAAGALITQQRLTDDVFRLVRLRSTPMITLFFLAMILAGVFGSSQIHEVRSQPETVPIEPTDPRPTLDKVFDDWLADTAACTKTLSYERKTYTVRPMIFVAAEGGGVRAAYWTVHSLGTLANQVPCAAHSTFLSSGVSGGAVGLSVVRFNAKPDQVMQEISSSTALSAGVIGTLLRDFAYSVSGIPLPAFGDQQPLHWRDRAALMEEVWNDSPSADWKDQSFVVPAGSKEVQPGTGQVILNSDALGNACRVWISQIQFSATSVSGANEVGQQGVDCDRAGTPALRSVDLISDYGPYVAASSAEQQNNEGSPKDGCVRGLTAATAGLLAARFPYVTPSGVIGPCRLASGATRGQDQLLDGGYLENSGLGTIVDLSPRWLALVQQQNAKAVATDRAAERILVVPMVVYLDNDTGNDRSASKRALTSEFLVPPTGKLRALSGLESDLAYLQRAKIVLDAEHICASSAVSPCLAAVGQLGDRRVFEFYQASTPKIAAPLGWILSDASRDTMSSALADQTRRVCVPPRSNASGLTLVDDAVCKRQFGTLGDLIQMLTVADY